MFEVDEVGTTLYNGIGDVVLCMKFLMYLCVNHLDM